MVQDSFKVVVPATKTQDGTTIVVFADDAESAEQIALRSHRNTIGVPGFTAFCSVQKVTLKPGDKFPIQA